MKTYKTEQEKFWAGNFGDEYIGRNKNEELLASNIHLFSKILNKTINVNSTIEFGANVGLNLIALRKLIPKIEASGIEINEKAIGKLKQAVSGGKVYSQSILDFVPDYKRDFVFTKGVLIHINPDKLKQAYKLMYQSSQKYICIIEYYNPKPIEINYRGHHRFLFKRDFTGELLSEYKDLRLVDYGFAYHLDNNFPQDDLNWFLLKKEING